MTTTAIDVAEAGKTYADGTVAVRGISFAVGEHEVFGLLGPNGAGKSTTLGMLTGTVRPTTGRVVVAGQPMSPDAIEVRRRMGVVFQGSTLDVQLSGRANLWLHGRLWGMPKREAHQRIAGLLDVIGLADRADQPVGAYSGGMRRRLEIARALLARPRILVLDEPTVGLDPIVRQDLWALITQLHHDEGVTVLLSTHYLEEAESVCDRVAIIDHGVLLALDAPDRLLGDLGSAVLEAHVPGDPRPVLDLLATEPVGPARSAVVRQAPQLRHQTVSAVVDAEAAGLSELVTAVQPYAASVAVRRTTLNDVFLQLTADGSRPDGSRSQQSHESHDSRDPGIEASPPAVTSGASS
jgi:ABC-2 type transport system ATP-binding protein